MKFLLDTNFLLIPAQFKVDIFSQLEGFGSPELFTLDLVVKELGRLDSRASRLALALLKRHRVAVLRAQGKGTDAALLRRAKRGFTLCTQDRALAARARERGIPVVALRQKKYLSMR